MRKIKYALMIMLTIMLVPTMVYARGSVSVSTTSVTITKGSSKTITVKANNSAGKINITSSNTNVASISTQSLFLDMQSSTITITGKKVGTATITIYNTDVTTYDDEDISGRSLKVNVKVVEPVVLSKDNSVKSITIDEYKLTKVDDNNYSLFVDNDIEKVNINLMANDSKAKVSGTGTKNLVVGENSIQVTIISESGSKNIINLKIIRKDGYHLSDLKKALNDNNPQIILSSTDIVSKDILNEIKSSKKTVILSQYDENKLLLYNWIIDGSEIDGVKDFNPIIIFESNYKNDIMKLTNYANGKYIHFNHDGDLPNGIRIKLYVGDLFIKDNLVKIYHYDFVNNKMNLTNEKIIVKDNYVEFPISHCSDYFITLATITNNSINNSINNNKLNILLIIVVFEFLIILILTILLIKKVKR